MGVTTSAYPLAWPSGWERHGARRERAPFRVSQHAAQQHVRDELVRLGARNVVISTNLRLRLDGMPYSVQPTPEDPGVAVYWTQNVRRGGKLYAIQRVMACDRWVTIGDNMRAIGLSIAALRGLERWGASDLIDKAFTGFTALPSVAAERPWWDVLAVPELADLEIIETAYRRLAKLLHPDSPTGSSERMAELNRAIEKARKARA